jgi:hypothetical protein
MKAPKLFPNSAVVLTIEGMGDSCMLNMYDTTRWPVRGETQRDETSPANPTQVRLYDDLGNLVSEASVWTDKYLKRFNLHFVNVTNSSVDFKSKTQHIDAKLRATNAFDRDAIHELIDYDS